MEREKDVVKPKTCYGGKRARNEIKSNLSNNEHSKEDVDDTSGDDYDDSSRTKTHHYPPSPQDYRKRVSSPLTKILCRETCPVINTP